MTKPPNLLLFVTDQQRGGTLLGDRRARLPHMESLAERGVRFRHARCPSPHCCPSRATLMTGRYPSEHGVWNNVSVGNALSRGLQPGVRTWSEDLAEAGYRCAWSGKWHVDDRLGPKDFGWEELTVKQGPRVMDDTEECHRDWQSYRQWANGDRDISQDPGAIYRPGWAQYSLFGCHEHPSGDAVTVGRAAAWLREEAVRSDRPWCLYVGPQGPHDPYCPPQRFLDWYPELPLPSPSAQDEMLDKPGMYRRMRRIFSQLDVTAQREAKRRYLALCSYEDWLLGQLLVTLEATGQAENTVVVCTSDHGDYLGDHGLWAKGLPGFSGAYEVPLVIAGPGIVHGNVVDDFVGLVDLGATIRELTGVLPDASSSGVSLVPFLRGECPSTWRDAWFSQSNGNEQYGIQRIVGERDWQYTYNGFDEDELYDLRRDPHQMRNVANDPIYAYERDRLCARMWHFAFEHGDRCVNGYITVALAPVGPASAFAHAATISPAV